MGQLISIALATAYMYAAIGSPYYSGFEETSGYSKPHSKMNQRKFRKRARQNPHSKKYNP